MESNIFRKLVMSFMLTVGTFASPVYAENTSSGATVITYSEDESYSWTAPADFAFSENSNGSEAKTATIDVLENKIGSGRTLRIKIAQDQKFELTDTSDSSNTRTYTVKDGSTTLSAGSEVLALESGANTASKNLTVKMNSVSKEYAGTYKGTLRFIAGIDGESTGSGSDSGSSGGTVDPPEPSVNLISFNVNGPVFQAEEGMTWEQWVASEYNTHDFYLEDGCVYVDGLTSITIDGETFDKGLVKYNDVSVLPSDVIIDQAYYRLSVTATTSYTTFSGLYDTYGMLYAIDVDSGERFTTTLFNENVLNFGKLKKGNTYDVYTVDGDVKVGQIVSGDTKFSFVPDHSGSISFDASKVTQYGITKIVSTSTGREIIGIIQSDGSILFKAITFPDTWDICSNSTKAGQLTLGSDGSGSYSFNS